MTTPNREDWKEEVAHEANNKLFKIDYTGQSYNTVLNQRHQIILEALSQTEQRIYKEMMEEIGEDEVRPFDVKFNKDENGETVIDGTALNNTVRLLRDQDEAFRRLIVNEERSRLREITTKKLSKNI